MDSCKERHSDHWGDQESDGPHSTPKKNRIWKVTEDIAKIVHYTVKLYPRGGKSTTVVHKMVQEQLNHMLRNSFSFELSFNPSD